MQGVVVSLAFVSADTDHAAILCANAGCLRERRRTARDRRGRVGRRSRSGHGADHRKANTPRPM